jgi:hypothetical protein
VLEVPLAVEIFDRPLRVLADRPGALVRAEARVVVDRVVGEVLGDAVGVARVQRRVVAADVVEAGQPGEPTAPWRAARGSSFRRRLSAGYSP